MEIKLQTDVGRRGVEDDLGNNNNTNRGRKK